MNHATENHGQVTGTNSRDATRRKKILHRFHNNDGEYIEQAWFCNNDASRVWALPFSAPAAAAMRSCRAPEERRGHGFRLAFVQGTRDIREPVARSIRPNDDVLRSYYKKRLG